MEMTKKNENLKYLIDRYSAHPEIFEIFCTNLYKYMGYEVITPSHSNKVNHTVLMKKKDETVLLKCKCYPENIKIGGFLLHQLISSNKELLADRMIFITTSDHTDECTKYANAIGIELVNGLFLVKLVKQKNKAGSTKEIRLD